VTTAQVNAHATAAATAASQRHTLKRLLLLLLLMTAMTMMMLRDISRPGRTAERTAGGRSGALDSIVGRVIRGTELARGCK